MPRSIPTMFVPRASIMIGIGLCERVYGLPLLSVVREVVSSHPPTTQWDLRRHGWRMVRGLWTDGADAIRVHTHPQPLPTISALRWAYDGKELTCLDPEHADEIRIEHRELQFLRMCLHEEDGWRYADPLWLSCIVRLARVLPLTQDVALDEVTRLYEECLSKLSTTHE